MYSGARFQLLSPCTTIALNCSSYFYTGKNPYLTLLEPTSHSLFGKNHQLPLPVQRVGSPDYLGKTFRVPISKLKLENPGLPLHKSYQKISTGKDMPTVCPYVFLGRDLGGCRLGGKIQSEGLPSRLRGFFPVFHADFPFTLRDFSGRVRVFSCISRVFFKLHNRLWASYREAYRRLLCLNRAPTVTANSYCPLQDDGASMCFMHTQIHWASLAYCTSGQCGRKILREVRTECHILLVKTGRYILQDGMSQVRLDQLHRDEMSECNIFPI